MSTTNTSLSRKVERAIKLLRSIPADEPIEISYSGGKDSDVILHLARMAGIPHIPIYKSSTIDPPGTIPHVVANGAQIIRPEKSFFRLIEEHGYPSRFVRFCCSILKEYKVKDRAIQGIRAEESVKRAAMYKEPEICRAYSKTQRVRVYLPILDWTLADEAEFIRAEGIQCHRFYYDEDGTFHPERRVGCLCCPLAYYKHRLNEFKRYPGMVRAYIRSGKKWMETHPNTKIVARFGDVYTFFVATTFFHHLQNFFASDDSLFPVTGYKQFLEDYFNIDLP